MIDLRSATDKFGVLLSAVGMAVSLDGCQAPASPPSIIALNENGAQADSGAAISDILVQANEEGPVRIIADAYHFNGTILSHTTVMDTTLRVSGSNFPHEIRLPKVVVAELNQAFGAHVEVMSEQGGKIVSSSKDF